MKTLLNRVLVTVLVLSLLMSSSAQLLATPAIAADEDFQDMKIGVMSDVHFQTAAGCTAESTVPTMLEQFKADNVDVIMITGDIGYACEDLEYEKFWNVWNSVFPDEETAPELFVISGNHEYDRVVFGKEELHVAQERFMKVFGLDEMNQHMATTSSASTAKTALPTASTPK